MPKIIWAQVAILLAIVLVFVLAVLALLVAPKDVVMNASLKGFSLQTITPAPKK